MNLELERLYREDLAEHEHVPAVGTQDYADLRQRDRNRRERARQILSEIADPESSDFYHAAWLFNHGDEPDEARLAYELASESAASGHADAKWLAAAAFDRWCMYRGSRQKYGTQIVPDGIGYRLWDVEPETTDDERARFGVPSIEAMKRRAEKLSSEWPQPDLGLAPRWLLDAIERWKNEPE